MHAGGALLINGSQRTAGVSGDNGSRQKLGIMRGEFAGGMVGDDILGAVQAFCAVFVELEQLDALQINTPKQVLDNKPELVAFRVDGVVVCTLLSCN